MTELANAASVALVRGGRVLLIQRAFPPFAGRWTLPGGRSEPGETPAETAIREVREELGLEVTDLQLLTERAQGEWRLAVFATSTFTGEIKPSDEIADWRWVARDHDLETTPGLGDVLRLIPGLA